MEILAVVLLVGFSIIIVVKKVQGALTGNAASGCGGCSGGGCGKPSSERGDCADHVHPARRQGWGSGQ